MILSRHKQDNISFRGPRLTSPSPPPAPPDDAESSDPHVAIPNVAIPAHHVVTSFEPKMGPETGEQTVYLLVQKLGFLDVLSFLRLHL